MKKIILASGYFNPIHPGHVEYLNLAKELGDELWVIVNNDKQAKIKRGVESFQDESYRITIVKNLKSVNEVHLCIDTDSSVCESIKLLHAKIKNKYPSSEIIFAKGGDRFANNIPEFEILTNLGIKIIDGLGDKTHHSSKIIEKIKNTK